MGWIYLGEVEETGIRLAGKIVHRKTVFLLYGCQSVPWLRENVDPEAESVRLPAKHKYALPLDEGMRRLLAPLARPYPKRAGSIDSDVASDQLVEGGASPTSALDLFGNAA